MPTVVSAWHNSALSSGHTYIATGTNRTNPRQELLRGDYYISPNLVLTYRWTSDRYQFFDDFLKIRLKYLEPVLAQREWLAGTFSVADILMADVLRPVDRFDGLAQHPACRDYLARATARPCFQKAYEDQMAHFAAGDAARAAAAA